GKKRDHLFRREYQIHLRQLARSLGVAAQLMQRCRPAQRIRHRERVPQAIGGRNRSFRHHLGLIRTANMPKYTSEKRIAGSAMVLKTKARRLESSALRIVQRDSLFQMSSRANQLGEPEKKVSHQELGVSEKAAILQLLGQLQAPLTGRKAY